MKDNNEYLVRPSMFILHCKKRGKVGREREKAKERERERERENICQLQPLCFSARRPL